MDPLDKIKAIITKDVPYTLTVNGYQGWMDISIDQTTSKYVIKIIITSNYYKSFILSRSEMLKLVNSIYNLDQK